MTAVPGPATPRLEQLGPISVIVLSGGMGKRMRQETQGRTSKVQLPIPQPPLPDGRETSETVAGMLVRTLAGLQALQGILLLTSEPWIATQARLADELAARYQVDVQCRSDTDTGDEFPPTALAVLTEQIGQQMDRGLATMLVNGDVLFGPQGFRSFIRAILDNAPLIALGEADHTEYLGLYYFSPDLNWRQLTRAIGAKTASDLMGGLWQRVPILKAKIEGPVYDCGCLAGYRAACADGRSGKLW